MENKKPKVLIAYIEAGMGHIVSTKAIAEQLKNKYGDKLEIVEKNICKGNPILEKFEQYLINDVKKANKNSTHSDIQFMAMQIFGPQNTLKLVHNTFFAKAKKEMCKIIEQENPDLFFSTHFAPLHFACELRNTKLNDMLVATYDPDPNVHGWWDIRGDLFLVNNRFARQEAIEKNKFNPNTVKQVNFTTREMIVNCNETREQLREKLEIPKDNFTVCLADGAYATAKLKDFTNELIKSKKTITLLVIAGKNEEVYKYFRLKRIQGKIPSNITLKIYKFVNNAHELYGASNLFITKAGPNAIQDSLFMGTPVLVNFFASQVEKATMNLFCNYFKCGVKILDKIKARKQVENWIDNPEELLKMQENTKKLDKTKNGSEKSAEDIFRLLTYHKPQFFEENYKYLDELKNNARFSLKSFYKSNNQQTKITNKTVKKDKAPKEKPTKKEKVAKTEKIKKEKPLKKEKSTKAKPKKEKVIKTKQKKAL